MKIMQHLMSALLIAWNIEARQSEDTLVNGMESHLHELKLKHLKDKSISADAHKAWFQFFSQFSACPMLEMWGMNKL